MVSVCVRVTVPAGVSTLDVVVVRERSVELCSAGGFTTVVEEVDAGGVDGTSCCMYVSFSFTTAGLCATVVGSLTTVVEAVVPGRSQPASAAATAMIAVGRTYLIDVSMGWDDLLRQRTGAAIFGHPVSRCWF
ncbi:MAG TPA: hypothetical protein VHP55_12935 [Usitatibacter sp.]|nr:hypothetical protein [Usitatibacter sp.]